MPNIQNKKKESPTLHSSVRKIVKDLQSSGIGWDIKQFIPGFLLYRYISAGLCSFVNDKRKKGSESNFNYATLKDIEAKCFRKEILEELGYFIYPSELFVNVRKHAKNNESLCETLENVFKNIEACYSRI